MKPYLICLDLDGTLLNDNKEISDYTKQVLTTLKARSSHYDCDWKTIPCKPNLLSRIKHGHTYR